MLVKDLVKRLESSKKFLTWKKSHQKAYLVHLFALVDKPNEGSWQIGYYLPSHDKITSFIIEDTIEIFPESDIFKKDKHSIKSLTIGTIKIDFQKVLDTVSTFCKEKYPHQHPLKTFLILQHLPKGQIWNVTYLTSSFSTLNIKLSASTGKIVSHEVVDFAQWQNNPR